MEHFLNKIPKHLAKQVAEHEHKNITEMAEALDTYTSIHTSLDKTLVASSNPNNEQSHRVHTVNLNYGRDHQGSSYYQQRIESPNQNNKDYQFRGRSKERNNTSYGK